MFNKSTNILKPKKQKVSWSDIVELVPDESPVKDLKVQPYNNKDSSTYSASEGIQNDTSVDYNHQKINKLLRGNQRMSERYEIHPAKGVPETLMYLDDYLTKSKNNEKSVEEKRERVESFFKDMIDKNELCIQFPADEGKISSVVSEHFKNCFETKTRSEFDGYFDSRKKIDSLVFGMPSNVVEDMLTDKEESGAPSEGVENVHKKNEAHKFEKYGYLGAKSSKNAPSTYGEVKFVFKKKSLLDRTTMTVGDSLVNNSYGVIASRLTNPKVESIPGVIKGDNTLLDITDKLIRTREIRPNMDPIVVAKKILADQPDKFGDMLDYFELQYHGDLKIEDIERCELPSKMSKKIREDIKKASGVKPKVIKGH